MPTATDRDFLDMPVSDVRLVTRFGRDQHVVLLQEPQSGRRLPIWIGQETAIEIALRQVATTPRSLPGRNPSRPARGVAACGGRPRPANRPQRSTGPYCPPL